MTGLNVCSEVGTLQRVLVHEPGAELLAVTPSNRSEYLYDDIIDLELAAEEHRRFQSILGRFCQVTTLRDALAETLENPEARGFLLQRSEEVTADRRLSDVLMHIDTEELISRYILGWRVDHGLFSEHLEQSSFVLPPLPNLFFTRDASVVVGDSVLCSAMRFASRWPESVLTRTLFGFHPDFGSPSILYDGSDERRGGYSFEGGDIHPLREDLMLVGLSERTTPPALDALCEHLFEQTAVRDVVAVVLPERSTAIHLDMVWTQVDADVCVAYPPMFRGPRRVPVLRFSKGAAGLKEYDTLFAALGDLSMPMHPVWAGGAEQAQREREQWASGCNLFALRPGLALAYARNEGTVGALVDAGFRELKGEALLLGDEKLEENDKAVITFHGGELVRGGGGPRCMTCPLERSDV